MLHRLRELAGRRCACSGLQDRRPGKPGARSGARHRLRELAGAAALAAAYKTVDPVSQCPDRCAAPPAGIRRGAALAAAYKTVGPVSQEPGRCAAPSAGTRRGAALAAAYKTVGPVSAAPPGMAQSAENPPSPAHPSSRAYTVATASLMGWVIG